MLAATIYCLLRDLLAPVAFTGPDKEKVAGAATASEAANKMPISQGSLSASLCHRRDGEAKIA